MSGLSEKQREDLLNLKRSLKESFDDIKKQCESDLEIDDCDSLDVVVLITPKLLNKYNAILSSSIIELKDLYSFNNKVKLERWKYYSGTQADKYYKEHGFIHEKILKGDIDKHLDADDKICLVNEIIAIQKSIVDYLERAIKEIQSRNFHCRAALDWRKFISGI